MSYQHSFDPDEADEPYVDYFQRGDGIPSRTVLARAEVFDGKRFDEDLKLREDPHLWTRLLRDHDATRVPEALATKRRRDDSITSDPEEVYRFELEEIDRLCEEYSELRPFRDQREAQATFRYGRQMLQRGNCGNARTAFHTVRRQGCADARLWACLLISYLPLGTPTAFELLGRLNELRK